MPFVKVFVLIYFVSLGFMYYLYYKNPGDPPLIPGDFYKIKSGRRFYFPLGSSLVIAAILYFVLNLLRKKFLG